MPAIRLAYCCRKTPSDSQKTEESEEKQGDTAHEPKNIFQCYLIHCKGLQDVASVMSLPIEVWCIEHMGNGIYDSDHFMLLPI